MTKSSLDEQSKGSVTNHEDTNGVERQKLALQALQETDKTFLKFQSNLTFLQQSLERSAAVKEKMVGILDRFDDRFSKLEDEMMEVNKRVDKLKMAHDNVDSTIKMIDSVVQKFGIPLQIEKRIEEGMGDVTSFLKILDKLTEAQSFFNKHTNYKGAEKVLIQLSALKQKAITMLESEFKKICLNCSKKEIDPYQISAQKGTTTNGEAFTNGFAGKQIEMMPIDALEDLSKIAKRLDSLNAIGYRKVYKDIRSKVIRKAMSRIYPEKEKKKPTLIKAPNNSSQAKKSEQEASKLEELDHEKQLSFSQKPEDKHESTKVYIKGNHKFIFYMSFYLLLLEEEQKITQKIVVGTQSNSIFGETIADSLKMFIERAQTLVDPHSTEKVFILLDILENFETKFSNFDKILANNQFLAGDMQNLLKAIKTNIVKVLEEKKSDIESNNSSVFKEGLVHEVTSVTFSFLKRLLDYRDTVENILGTLFFTDGKKLEMKTFFGRYIKYIVGAVEESIEKKSKEYKQPSLQSLFILNNHYHILKKLKHADMKMQLNENYINSFVQKVKKDQEDYLIATWGKALEFLTKDLTKKIAYDKKGEYTSTAKKDIKARLKSFNSNLNEIHSKQRLYSIPDVELRELMRQRTVETVVPVYENFVSTYGKLNFSKKPQKYISYEAKTLEEILCQLYDENIVN